MISVCFTNYNRTDLLINAFAKIYDDERISEFVISDDCSNMETYKLLSDIFRHMPKVKMYRNEVNQDCYRNKATAISLASNEYVCILDSDNEFDTSYIDAIYGEQWDADTILMPSWAKPTFNYKAFGGMTFSKENVAEYMGKPMYSTMLNCMNYFVNKEEYLRVWDGSENPHTADTIYQNSRWFQMGNKMKVVDAMEYSHLIHNGSHYKNNVHLTGDFYNKVEKNLLNMK